MKPGWLRGDGDLATRAGDNDEATDDGVMATRTSDHDEAARDGDVVMTKDNDAEAPEDSCMAGGARRPRAGDVGRGVRRQRGPGCKRRAITRSARFCGMEMHHTYN